MTTPAEALWRLAGAPDQEGCQPVFSPCIVCAGAHGWTIPFDKWAGSTYTDQNKLRGAGLSSRVCAPCVWAHSWVPPPGHAPPEPGKKGVNLRLFWHAYDGAGYVYGNKANKPELVAWLRAPRKGLWFCAIPDSGQKHTLPWVRWQAPGAPGAVLFEEQQTPIGSWQLFDGMAALLSAGATKASVQTGAYTPREWQQVGADALTGFEARWGALRGGAWWTLALWLAQRAEEGGS